MRAGKLDTPITIKALTVGADGMGSPTTSYIALANGPRWAQYLPYRGEERMLAGQLAQVTDFKLRIRRDTRIDSSHRVEVDGDECEIVGIPEDNRRWGDMVLHCRKVG